ncbi:hypothetical protein ACLQ2R_04010 [Streptosporangium sp. DT93]
MTRRRPAGDPRGRVARATGETSWTGPLGTTRARVARVTGASRTGGEA